MHHAVLKIRELGLRRGSWRRDEPACAARLTPIGICGGSGYVFVARNYMPRGAKGEIDLIGYDGKTLAFVEVRTRTVRDDADGAAGVERHDG